MPWLISSISRLFYCNYDLTDFIWLLLLHCFIATIISLISPIPGLFYRNYYSVAFFYFTTVLLRLRFGWFNMAAITPLFYGNYDLDDVSSYSNILLELWFGFFPLFHDCLTGNIIWVILFDFHYTTVLYQLWFLWSLLLHHYFIPILICDVSSVARLFYCKYNFGDFFNSTTVFIAIMI